METPTTSTSHNKSEITTYENSDITVIRSDPHYSSGEELNAALEDQKTVIVIRNPELGKKTVLWLFLGKCVRHMTLVTAVGTAICCGGFHDTLYDLRKPCAIASVMLNVGYLTIWRPFQLSDYRIAQGSEIICPMAKYERPPNTILVRNVEPYAGVLYSLVSAAALALAFWNDIVIGIDFKEWLDKIVKSAENADTKTVKK